MGVGRRGKSQPAVDPLAATATQDDVRRELDEFAPPLRAARKPPQTGEEVPAPDAPPEANKPAADRPAADARDLKSQDWPARATPAITAKRQAGYQVIFRQSVLDEIHAHAGGNVEVEICGVLVGNVYHDDSGPYAYIEAAIRGNDAVTQQTQVTITSETWSKIHEALERDHPDKRIIGWYHSHPGFGIFLSGMDLFIQENFFNAAWQVAFVYDPVGHDEGVFVWRGGRATREPHLVENDTGAAVVTSGSNAGAIVEIQRRIDGLENKVIWLTTATIVLLAVALLWPLAFISYFPDTVRGLINTSDEQPIDQPSKDSPRANPIPGPDRTSDANR
ncbi:MAG TPA: Mov34/MPN/PAD-1 family protein [Humisphaera sp.]|jgi:proteasome lid subunit RPN8/RPN11|nr:Mov34/MPN/PAD-1 family protein [Humisphaera sp.]